MSTSKHDYCKLFQNSIKIKGSINLRCLFLAIYPEDLLLPCVMEQSYHSYFRKVHYDIVFVIRRYLRAFFAEKSSFEKRAIFTVQFTILHVVYRLLICLFSFSLSILKFSLIFSLVFLNSSWHIPRAFPAFS